MPRLVSNFDGLRRADNGSHDNAESTESTQGQSSCRSLVLSGDRTIALFPPSAQRNVHPSASTSHLHPSIAVHPLHTFGLAGISSCVKTSPHESLPFPATFQQLQNNTDLRLAPSTAPQYHPPIYRPHFTSFQMAHRYVEYLQEVDVVSDAENIKELLKMPFNPKAEVSLLVHRVGRTLLLDPFSVLEQHRSDWTWLHRFQNIVFQKLRKGDSRSAVTKHHADAQQSAFQLVTRFLHYTLMAQQRQQQEGAASSTVLTSPTPPKLPGLTGAEDKEGQQPKPFSRAPQPKGGKWDKINVKQRGRKQANKTNGGRPETPDTAVIPVSMTTAVQDRAQMMSALDDAMPEPEASDQVPDEGSDAHARNIIWNFENLRMLIGTDLPIFGGDTRPCVSLRLTDMSKPINVLTGLDYWLDNLMCNVPEVAMCFHLAGIVQKYERIKTEELPELRDSTFSPSLVKDIAKNILTFLKDNTTHEGHTYWLFKSEDDDVVKLYDLTSLGLDGAEDGEQEASAPTAPVGEDDPAAASNINPFTVPAGMLFYRVAKNLLSDPTSRNKAATISQLLHNCIKLLDHGRYPEIVSSAHYHISDILMVGDSAVQDFQSESSGEDYEDVPTQPGQMVFKTTHKQGDSNKSSGDVSSAEAKKTKKKHKKKASSRHNTTARPGEAGQSLGPAVGAAEGGSTDQQQPSITLSTLSLPNTRGTFNRSSHSYKPPKLTNDFHKRCWISVSHVVKGLSCILTPNTAPVNADSQQQDEYHHSSEPASDEPQMAKSYESIPLPYESLSKKLTSEPRPSPSVEPCTENSQDVSMPQSATALRTQAKASSSNGVVARHRSTASSVASTTNTAAAAATTTTTTAATSVCSVVSAEGGPAEVGADTSVVPSSPCVSVNLSSVKYDVSSQASKLKVMLLHKAAIVYKMLADNALSRNKLAVATENIELCVRCCYAVCLELRITTVFDATPQPGSCYPFLRQALLLAADIMYCRGKDQSKTASSSGGDEGCQAHTATSEDSSNECHCCSSDPCSDNSRMNQFLDDMMPPLYRAQFKLPVTAVDLYSCMEMGQLYLILAMGGKIGACNERQDSNTQQSTPTEAQKSSEGEVKETPAVDASPTSSDDDISVPAWLASVLNVDLNISEEFLNKNPSLLIKLSGVMNEMACTRINQAQEECCANLYNSSAVLAPLALERKRLELAVYFFQQLGDIQNVAVTHTNLAKYHRVVAFFMPESRPGECYGATEDEHYRLAVSNYRAALSCLEEQTAANNQQRQRKLHQQQKKNKNKKNKPAKPASNNKNPSRDASSHEDGAEKAAQQLHNGETEVLETDEFRNNILLNEANTLMQQADSILKRPPLPAKEGSLPTLSSAIAVLQQSYDNLQCMPRGYNTQQCIDKTVLCCEKLATLYCSANPPGGGQCDVAASVSWREKQCRLLASTQRHKEALQAVVEHCDLLLQPSQEENIGFDGQVLALESLRLLVHSEYLVVGVTGPGPQRERDLLLNALEHLKMALKKLCQSATAASTSGSSPLVAVDAAKKSFLEALQLRDNEPRLSQRLTTLLQSVGRSLSIDKTTELGL